MREGSPSHCLKEQRVLKTVVKPIVARPETTLTPGKGHWSVMTGTESTQSLSMLGSNGPTKIIKAQVREANFTRHSEEESCSQCGDGRVLALA